MVVGSRALGSSWMKVSINAEPVLQPKGEEIFEEHRRGPLLLVLVMMLMLVMMMMMLMVVLVLVLVQMEMRVMVLLVLLLVWLRKTRRSVRVGSGLSFFASFLSLLRAEASTGGVDALHGAVPVILDRIVCPSGQLFRNFRPSCIYWGSGDCANVRGTVCRFGLGVSQR